MLISTLTKNLARMEPSTKRNAVSHYPAVGILGCWLFWLHWACFSYLADPEEGSLIFLFVCFSLCETDWECVRIAGQAGYWNEREGSIRGVDLCSSAVSGVSEWEHAPPHSSDILQTAWALAEKAVRTTDWKGLDTALYLTLALKKINYYLHDGVIETLRALILGYQINTILIFKYCIHKMTLFRFGEK